MIRTPSDPRISYVLTAILAGLLLFLSQGKPTGDFGNYYYGSALAENKLFDQIYNIQTFNELVEKRHSGDQLFLNHNPVPPFSLLFFGWMDMFEIGTAKLIWNILSLGLLLLSLYRLIKFLNKESLLVPLSIAILFIPFKANLEQGQGYFLIGFLLIEGYLAWDKDKPWLAALCWAAAFHLKIFPVIIVLFLIQRKDWKTLLYFSTVSIGILFLTTIYSGWTTTLRYFFESLPRLAAGEINNTYIYYYQSLQVLLKNLFVPDQLHNPDYISDMYWIYKVGDMLFKGLILGAVYFLRASKTTHYGLWIFVSILISGYGTTYSLVLLIIPLITMEVPKRFRIMIMILILIAVSIPLLWLIHLPDLLQYPRFFLLLVAIIAMVVTYKIKIEKVPLIILVSGCVIITIIGWKTPSDSEYFLNEEVAILTHHFEVEQDSVVLYTRHINGDSIQKKTLGFTAKDLRLLQNGIEVNDSIILFLSDENRGVGFNALRKKPANE